MGQEVITQTLVEAGELEEEVNGKVTADAFLPSAPLTTKPPAWIEGSTYAKGALVEESGHGYFRSLEAGNKEHTPHSSPTHWAPVSISLYPLQNPNYQADFTPIPNPERKEP